VKYDGTTVAIDYDNGAVRAKTESGDKPSQTFTRRLSKLRDAVLHVAEIDCEPKLITVTGVRIVRKGDERMFVLIAKKALLESNSPLNLNLPPKPEFGDNGMPQEFVAQIDSLLEAAEEYARGQMRAQLSLFQPAGTGNGMPAEEDAEELYEPALEAADELVA